MKSGSHSGSLFFTNCKFAANMSWMQVAIKIKLADLICCKFYVFSFVINKFFNVECRESEAMN